MTYVRCSTISQVLVEFFWGSSGSHILIASFFSENGLTDWLSGSGGIGETLHIIAPSLANRAYAERQSRYPTGAGVGRHFGGEHVTHW
jgi:hypothetical protein